MKSTSLASLLLLIPLLFFSCNEQQQPFRSERSFVGTGSQRLEVFSGGNGENTIVFESGLGVDGKSWIESGIYDSLGQNNKVIAYNRAGYGKSSPGTQHRGMNELVKDLERLINEKATHSKVILIGHSLGGAIVRAYAAKHPSKIKALMFIEPNCEFFSPYAKMNQEEEDQLVKQFEKEKEFGAAAEAKQLRENVSCLENLPTLPDVPVVVISSTKTDEEMTPEMVKQWVAAHEKLGKGIKNFRHVKTGQSGHFVYLDEPDLVLKTARSLLE